GARLGPGRSRGRRPDAARPGPEVPHPARPPPGDARETSASAEKTLDSPTHHMRHETDDLRIERIRPLIPPAILMENLPLSEAASTTVAEGRTAVARALRGQDDRLVVIVGPCSIHDVKAARE